jgi:hypothetical protein
MEGSEIPLNRLSDEAVIYLFSEQLPALLDQRPELESRIYHAFWKAFARREEIAAVMEELSEFRAETRASFEQVEQRFESIEARMEAGFQEVQRSIDRLGARWGIRNESLFRQTIAELLEKSFLLPPPFTAGALKHCARRDLR